MGLGTGVFLNNCSHTEGANGPAIGFILVISCCNPCRVTLSLSPNEDFETCPAASIAETILYSGDSPVSRDNCDGVSVAGVTMAFNI
jgi:hypothetical protein